MNYGIKNLAIIGVLIASSIIIVKVVFYPSYKELNKALNTEYFEGCKTCSNKSWSISSIGNASIYTRLFYFSRLKGSNFTEINFHNVSSVYNSGFDKSKNTKILIHGWLDSAFVNFAVEIRKAYQAAQDVNIVAVDWSPVASLFYPIARIAVEPIGRFLAQFIDWLVTETGVSLGSLHIIGHSLGAHIGGVVGEHVTAGKIGRATGLDPAGPGFDSSKRGRLDSSDAQFVDVIHTSGLWAGFYDACGHVDFYPNKGVPNQPGCPLDFGKCSHIRSYKLFSESISSTNFISRACGNWKDFISGVCENNCAVVMGEHVDLSARGKFYLQTSTHSKFALGNNKL